MKLIYVTAHFPCGPGEAFLTAEVRHLMGLGHEVLLAPRSPRRGVVHAAGLLTHAQCEKLISAAVASAAIRAAVHRHGRIWCAVRGVLESRSLMLGLKNASVLPKALWLAELAARWGAGHIHSHWAGTTATMAMIAGALSGIPWSFTAHRWDIVEDNLLSVKVRSATLARFISEDGWRMARERGIRQAPNVRIIHMGVDVPAKASWRPPDVPVVLCPANLVKVKGHEYLVRAWQILRARGINAQLWLAGGGGLRAELESLVRALELRDSIQFLGIVHHSVLLKLYETSAVSAVVLPSVDRGQGEHEGVPVALMEAMSYGVPVITTRTGGIGELVAPGAGEVVPQRDPGALAEAVQKLLTNRMLAIEVGAAGRRRVLSSYNAAQIAQQLAAALNPEPAVMEAAAARGLNQ